MKIFFSLLSGCMLFTDLLFSQGTSSYSITLFNTHNQPMANTPITLIESSTKERISKNTDGGGKVSFVLTTGREWHINILQVKNYGKVTVPERGKAQGSTFITYDYVDWERRHRTPVDRSALKLEVVKQSGIDVNSYNAQEATVELNISRLNKSGLKNFPVNLTCYKLQKSFTTTTDNSGHAAFKVPINNEYDIDIDGVECFNYIDIKNKTGNFGLDFTYEPTTIKETNKNDTIIQSFSKTSTGTSGRTYAKFHIGCSDCDKLTDEVIYIDMIKSNKVYKARLDANGNAEFLLPIKKMYMINFRFQRDVDVIDLSDFEGISEYQMSVAYRPKPELKYPEKYLISPEQLMVNDFKEFLTKQFPPPKPNNSMGMFLTWYDPEVNAQSKEAVLEIGFTVPDGTADATGPPLNVCFVVDKSGSMAGNDRIDQLKKAMLKYTKQLRSTDIVSLVAFDDKFVASVPAQKMGDGKYLRDMIEDLNAGGGTNIFSGLEEGYKQVMKNMIPKGTNRVVLLTDGYDGIPVDSTVGMSKRYNAKGIELSAVGVGNDFNVALLSQLATVGGGLLQFAGDSKDIDKVFAKEMTSILNPVAKDVTVEIEFNGKIVFKQLYGFPYKKVGSDLVSMKLDNIYRGLNTLSLAKFELNNPTQEIEKQPVTVRLKYFDCKKNAMANIMEQANLKWSPNTGKLELIIDQQQKKMYAVAITNQSLKAMADSFAKGDYQGLNTALSNALRQLKDLFPKADDSDINKLVKSMENYSATVTQVLLIKKQTKN